MGVKTTFFIYYKLFSVGHINLESNKLSFNYRHLGLINMTKTILLCLFMYTPDRLLTSLQIFLLLA